MEVSSIQACKSIFLEESEIRCMEMTLDENDAADWVYRGEGAVNLVLAYSGSSPAFVGKVMRIQKCPKNGSRLVNTSATLSSHERLLWRDVNGLVSSTDKDIVNQLYVQHVIGPLLGPKLVDSGVRVLVTKGFLELIEKNVNHKRPAWRIDTGMINSHCGSVLLLSDHSLFPHGLLESETCISVEIKPKCGFLPTSRFIAERNIIKQIISRFRMHQVLKLHQGEVSELSPYNPLDLFSGSQERMYKAIKDLFSTPQNNFRVFLNGSLIFGTLGGRTGDNCLAIGEAFEDAVKKSAFWKVNGLHTESFLHLVAMALYESGIMDRLLEIQKLDKFDIEGAIHAFYDVIAEPCQVCRQLSTDESQLYSSLHSIPRDQSLTIVKEFLVSATAKDCSVMIAFKPRKDCSSGSTCNSVYLESADQTFDYKVNFIDLDLKPLKKMEEYYKLDQKIVSCYNQMVVAEQEAERFTNVEKAYKCTCR